MKELLIMLHCQRLFDSACLPYVLVQLFFFHPKEVYSDIILVTRTQCEAEQQYYHGFLLLYVA